MLKKEYIKPEIQVVLLQIHNVLLVGSDQDADVDGELNDGYGD